MQTTRGSCLHNLGHEKTRIEITDENCIHAGKVVCDECNKFIRWASKREVKEWKSEQGVTFTLPDVDDSLAVEWNIKLKFAFRDGDEVVVDYENYSFSSSPMAVIRWRQLQVNPSVVDVCLIAERRHDEQP